MAIDQAWIIQKFRAIKDLATRDTLKYQRHRDRSSEDEPASGKERIRDWQRRLSSRISFRTPSTPTHRNARRSGLLYALTSGTATKESIEDALKDDLAPLASVFRADTHS